MIKEPYIPVETEMLAPTGLHDELSSMLAVIAAIPDGLRLFNFPRHVDGPDCWCRPGTTVIGETLIVSHKDLDKGEFDC